MLAVPSAPFDDERWGYELKFDGIRALAHRDHAGHRLLSRHGVSMGEAFPEVAPLSQLPAGTVLDGELIVLVGGKPSLAAVLRRFGVQHPLKARHRAARSPATLVIFDCLYSAGQNLLTAPFTQRRAEAERLVEALQTPTIVVPEYFVGTGQALFEAVCGQGLEGVVAKRLDSTYQPGRRCRTWRKIKSKNYQPDVAADDPRWGRSRG